MDGGGPEKGGTGCRGYGRGVHGLKRAGGQKEIHRAEQEAREDMKIIRHPGATTEASRRQKFFADVKERSTADFFFLLGFQSIYSPLAPSPAK